MRTWRRLVASTLRCGLCGKEIKVGDPYMERSKLTETTSWRQLRCQACAGEPVPADLPPLAPRVEHKPIVPVRFSADSLPLDWKQQQSGESK